MGVCFTVRINSLGAVVQVWSAQFTLFECPNCVGWVDAEVYLTPKSHPCEYPPPSPLSPPNLPKSRGQASSGLALCFTHLPPSPLVLSAWNA